MTCPSKGNADDETSSASAAMAEAFARRFDLSQRGSGALAGKENA